MQHLILIGTAISAIIAPFVLAGITVDTTKSLSAHIAQTKKSIWFARVAILLVCVLVALWYAGWYAPTYDPSIMLTALVTSFCLLAAVVAIFPRHEGTTMGTVHDTAAYGYSFIVPFVIILMAFNAHNDTTMYALVFLTYLLWAILAAGAYKPAWQYFLYFQLSFITLFGVGLIIATYGG